MQSITLKEKASIESRSKSRWYSLETTCWLIEKQAREGGPVTGSSQCSIVCRPIHLLELSFPSGQLSLPVTTHRCHHHHPYPPFQVHFPLQCKTIGDCWCFSVCGLFFCSPSNDISMIAEANRSHTCCHNKWRNQGRLSHPVSVSYVAEKCVGAGVAVFLWQSELNQITQGRGGGLWRPPRCWFQGF